jgi:hypothetical protein
MFLGCDDRCLRCYEGPDGFYGYAVWPTPLLVPAQLLLNAEDDAQISEASYVRNATTIFREDSFDPITRIRRGRLYEKAVDEEKVSG